MSDWQNYLDIAKRMDPRVAVILFTGLGIVATAPVVSNWYIDLRQAGTAGLYVLLVGAAAILVMTAVNDPRIKATLSWFLALSMMAAFLVFFTSAVRQEKSPFPPVPCLLELTRMCSDVLDKQADRLHTPPPAIKVQPTRLPASVVEEIDRRGYQVYVQFAGIIRREDVVALSSGLNQSGWGMQPATITHGGERTSAAAGYNEVRYGPEKDKAAAILLAHQVEQKNLTGARIKAVQNPAVSAGRLEVWLSY